MVHDEMGYMVVHDEMGGRVKLLQNKSVIGGHNVLNIN